MKNLKKIILNIQNDKELSKRIEKRNYTDVNDFVNNANRYIKAIKSRAMMCKIDKVSASGMSRNIKFFECSKGKNGYNVLNFFALFELLGYTNVKNTDTFRINGCGMDMIFHTNYSIIHELGSLGFLSKNEVSKLAQMTPHVI